MACRWHKAGRRVAAPLLVLTAVLGGCATSNGTASLPAAQTRVAPPVVAPLPLIERVRSALNRSELAGTRWGLFVADDAGRELLGISPDERFVPASNTKIFTVAAAFMALPGIDTPTPATAVGLEPRGRDIPALDRHATLGGGVPRDASGGGRRRHSVAAFRRHAARRAIVRQDGDAQRGECACGLHDGGERARTHLRALRQRPPRRCAERHRGRRGRTGADSGGELRRPFLAGMSGAKQRRLAPLDLAFAATSRSTSVLQQTAETQERSGRCSTNGAQRAAACDPECG